jgi:hypothetical protein
MRQIVVCDGGHGNSESRSFKVCTEAGCEYFQWNRVITAAPSTPSISTCSILPRAKALKDKAASGSRQTRSQHQVVLRPGLPAGCEIHLTGSPKNARRHRPRTAGEQTTESEVIVGGVATLTVALPDRILRRCCGDGRRPRTCRSKNASTADRAYARGTDGPFAR